MTATAKRTELNTSFERYADTGYVMVPDALSPAEIERITADGAALCRGDYGAIPGDYGVIPSAEGDVPYGGSNAAGESDEDTMRRFLCIHHPHKLSQVMRDALHQPTIVDAMTRVIGPDVKSMQSMLFMKAEGKPGQAWHQDEYFIPTRDRSLTAAWIALDDATVDNGCLWVLPGSHKPGVIYPDREHDDPDYDCSVELYDFPYSDDDAVPVELPAGSALVFNGYLLHKSFPNRAERGFRRALVNHYMSASSLLPWYPPREGEHMAKADYRDVELVAGRDPYAYKGTEDLARPGVRPDREGGCDR